MINIKLNNFIKIIKYVIFCELDANKTNGTYSPSHEETITSMILIKETAYILTSCSTG